MILSGSNLAPFARRVTIWCSHQGRPIERRELGALGPGHDEIRQHNPLGRLPVLILGDGTRLVESVAATDPVV
jgi:glutathione S-transferase